MNYLLDTHALIWFITNDPKLHDEVKNEIKNVENSCFISIASLWEIGIKYSLGKLELKGSLQEIFNIIELSSLEILPITPAHILQNTIIALNHRDPFDRILIAQAQIENLTIITKDSAFAFYNVNIKWN